MSGSVAKVLLWLFVLNLGVAFGAGLYEHRIVVPEWLGLSEGSGPHWNAEAVRRHDTGRRFWAFVTTGPLTLITLLNLIAAWRASGTLRHWWLAAALVALIDRAWTFGYFIPTMVGLMGVSDPVESAATGGTVVEPELSPARHRAGRLVAGFEGVRVALSTDAAGLRLT